MVSARHFPQICFRPQQLLLSRQAAVALLSTAVEPRPSRADRGRPSPTDSCCSTSTAAVRAVDHSAQAKLKLCPACLAQCSENRSTPHSSAVAVQCYSRTSFFRPIRWDQLRRSHWAPTPRRQYSLGVTVDCCTARMRCCECCCDDRLQQHAHRLRVRVCARVAHEPHSRHPSAQAVVSRRRRTPTRRRSRSRTRTWNSCGRFSALPEWCDTTVVCRITHSLLCCCLLCIALLTGLLD